MSQIMKLLPKRMSGVLVAVVLLGVAGALLGFTSAPRLLGLASNLVAYGQLDEATEMDQASKIIGPDKFDNNCSSCHTLEAEAWLQTRHYATFKDRHRSDRAKEILQNMDQKSMKRAGDCRSCHYTSIVKNDKLRATWGVSCESCHSPGRDWNDIHNKEGGDPTKATVVWGKGKDETPELQKARLDAAEKAGMIHSQMIYDIATNCFSCHTVPNETLVNKGNHLAGSDFDLVAWSQGEIRHNFSSSPGAPDNATNRKATAEQKRRIYVVGAVVDLEYTLRNLANVKEVGGAFHKAMIERGNATHAKVKAILDAVALDELKVAFDDVPHPIDESTKVEAAVADKLGKANKQFAASHDGTQLGAIDGLIPTDVKGKAHKE